MTQRQRHPPPPKPRSDSPTSLDWQRWRDFRSGMSVKEIAARENIKLSTVEKSLEKMRGHAARNSQESVELATREVYLDQLPNAISVFERALHAKKSETQYIFNPDTQESKPMTVEVDDIDTQLSAIDKLKALLAGVTPKTPMVAVDARTQINNPASAQLGPGALSSESIIRQVRAQPNYQLSDGQIRTIAQQTEEEIGIEVKREQEEVEAEAEPEPEYVEES